MRLMIFVKAIQPSRNSEEFSKLLKGASLLSRNLAADPPQTLLECNKACALLPLCIVKLKKECRYILCMGEAKFVVVSCVFYSRSPMKKSIWFTSNFIFNFHAAKLQQPLLTVLLKFFVTYHFEFQITQTFILIDALNQSSTEKSL